MVLFHGAMSYEHLWFWVGRLARGPRTEYYSTHPSVLLMQCLMIWSCLGWMCVLDWNPKRWPLVVGPAVIAFGAAVILPPYPY